MRFNGKKEAENVIKFVKDYYKNNNLKGAIVGLSGGKDSAVVTAILVNALGKENVVGVTMPCNSISEDKKDAEMIADFYGIECINYDLTDTFNTFKGELDKTGIEYSENDLKNSDINVRPRLRMATLYYIAALYSSLKGGTYLVAGTPNKSELYVGYFTKGGDQVHDFEVISDFTVSEVIKIGEYLKVPEKVLYKTPSDGLSGKSDEDKMGITYDDIEKYIYAKPLDEAVKEKIARMHNNNKHKFNMPAYKRPRVGVFVGSFDPIHKGHMHIIKYLLQYNLVDKIIVVPTGDYWSKSMEASLEDRIQMCKLIQSKKVEISTTLNKYEYTYQVLEELEKKYPMDYLFLIMGADNIINFDKWKNIDHLLEYNIIVVNRDNIDINEHVEKFNKKDNFIVLDDFDFLSISSTYIRSNIESENAKEFLDEKVLNYIKDKKLYLKK